MVRACESTNHKITTKVASYDRRDTWFPPLSHRALGTAWPLLSLRAHISPRPWISIYATNAGLATASLPKSISQKNSAQYHCTSLSCSRVSLHSPLKKSLWNTSSLLRETLHTHKPSFSLILHPPLSLLLARSRCTYGMPSTPFSPFFPSLPADPLAPVFPLEPCGPTSPSSPLSPGGPSSPGTP